MLPLSNRNNVNWMWVCTLDAPLLQTVNKIHETDRHTILQCFFYFFSFYYYYYYNNY
jgi:hypothetical protein